MILVFGSNGQLGQELTRQAKARGISLHGLPRDAVDIADEAAVERAVATLAPALIVNAAAYTKVDAAEDHWADAYRTNADGAAVIARVCAAHGLPLIHISTDYVFDGSKSDAYVESDPIAPVSAYGRSKAAGEAAVRQCLPHHVILRTAWVYGEFGANFLKTILRLSQERDELRIVADQHGCPTSTRDLARAILTIAPDLIAGTAAWGTYHFAGDGKTTWYDFARHIVATQAPITAKRPNVLPIATHEFPTKATRPANSVLDSNRFRSAFGFGPAAWQEECESATTALLRNEAANHA